MDPNLRHMNKVTDQLPGYMKNNLKKMPENKGYIHRGVWFFGKRRKDNNKMQLMFEKINNDTLHIHKITDKFHIISEKNQRTNKVKQISKEKRVQLFKGIDFKYDV